MRRRSFLVGGISGTALVACRPWTRPSTAADAPTEHELATIAAIAETFVPGGDGTPGAREVNALATIIDPVYGVNPYVSEVVSDLDEWCLVRHHHLFVDLSPDQRELALEERMGLRNKLVKSLYLPAYEGILVLTKLAFFGALANRAGTNYIGFPGASRGYAPGSAAGAYAARDTPRAIAPGARSQLRVEGAGAATVVRVTAVAITPDDLRATVRIHSPDGRNHVLPLHAVGGDAVLDDVAIPLVNAAAAGVWILEVATLDGGSGQLELWSLRLRTDLDDAARMP